MIEIIPFRSEHLANMKLQGYMRELAQDESIRAALGKDGMAWSALMDGRVVACAGILPQWTGRAVGWAVFGECLPLRAWFKITKAAKRVLDETQKSGFQRIEITVKEDFPQGHRWARALGFEAGQVMRKYAPDGSDHRMWERVA